MVYFDSICCLEHFSTKYMRVANLCSVDFIYTYIYRMSQNSRNA